MMRAAIVFAIITVSMNRLSAQSFDTLRIMTYNLTYYGQTTSFCTSSNNVISEKDANLKTICKHVAPDVLVVNEMGASSVYTSRIINNVLNTNGVGFYEKCAIQNNSFSDLANGMFYNKNKLALVKQEKVSKDLNNGDLVRVIDVNRFYYRDEALAYGGDTVFFFVAAAHLKAGNTTSDELDRESAALALMNFIELNKGEGYFILCGDMNLKGSSEGAYQAFVTSNFPFTDPINQEGNWYNNSQFAQYHTQSTRTSETNSGCFSGGGLDDRFDLILMTGPVIQDTGDISYVEDSYHTYGQDGNHFNLPVNNVPNNSEPVSVIAALYGMSDHLPVSAEIRVRLNDMPDTATYVNEHRVKSPFTIWLQSGELRIESSENGADCKLFSLAGMEVKRMGLDYGFNAVSLHDFPDGVYFVQCTSAQYYFSKKVVLTH